ncbi:MAG TPA: hypothetical protein VGM53_29570 [Streptosporangiaceae bacterium]
MPNPRSATPVRATSRQVRRDRRGGRGRARGRDGRRPAQASAAHAQASAAHAQAAASCGASATVRLHGRLFRVHMSGRFGIVPMRGHRVRAGHLAGHRLVRDAAAVE